MKMQLTESARKFINRGPTMIGIVRAVRFYEHPIEGDESPLVAIFPNGTIRRSPFWDMPDFEEVCDWIQGLK